VWVTALGKYETAYQQLDFASAVCVNLKAA
jgi:hypothetical protein